MHTSVYQKKNICCADNSTDFHEIFCSSPIHDVIDYIESNRGVGLVETGAQIGQLQGVQQDFDLGFKHVAVTVTGFQTKIFDGIKDFEAAAVDNLVLSVCNTCVSKSNVNHITIADVVCASASNCFEMKSEPKYYYSW